MIKKILVVDDDKEWNLVLKMALQKSGYAVTQAFNGKEAVDKVAQDMPDLVLLDVTMPIMSGWEVCEALRADPASKDLPIFILSSYSSPVDIEQGKMHRIKRYLIKPCSLSDVLQNVRDVSNEGS